MLNVKKNIKKAGVVCSETVYGMAHILGVYTIRKTIFYIDMATDVAEILANTKNGIIDWCKEIEESE